MWHGGPRRDSSHCLLASSVVRIACKRLDLNEIVGLVAECVEHFVAHVAPESLDAVRYPYNQQALDAFRYSYNQQALKRFVAHRAIGALVFTPTALYSIAQGRRGTRRTLGYRTTRDPNPNGERR